VVTDAVKGRARVRACSSDGESGSKMAAGRLHFNVRAGPLSFRRFCRAQGTGEAGIRRNTTAACEGDRAIGARFPWPSRRCREERSAKTNKAFRLAEREGRAHFARGPFDWLQVSRWTSPAERGEGFRTKKYPKSAVKRGRPANPERSGAWRKARRVHTRLAEGS